MTNQVNVTLHPETGVAVNPTSNPDIYRLRVEQTTNTFNGGFVRAEKRSALINGPKEVLEGLAKQKVLQGKIVVEESTTEFWAGQDPKINPTTSEVVMHNGQPVYRRTTFTQDVNAQDVLVQSTVSVQAPVGATNGEA